jgi:hypothetical protein
MPDPKSIHTLLGAFHGAPVAASATNEIPENILPRSQMSDPAWSPHQFCENWALGLGGSVNIVRSSTSGKTAAFVPDPAKLTTQQVAEITRILNRPKYATASAAAK